MNTLTHYTQRVYTNSENNIVSDRYGLYQASASQTIETDKDIYLDELSLVYYGTPLYYWVIGEFNNIADPFVKIKKGTSLKIPVI